MNIIKNLLKILLHFLGMTTTNCYIHMISVQNKKTIIKKCEHLRSKNTIGIQKESFFSIS